MGFCSQSAASLVRSLLTYCSATCHSAMVRSHPPQVNTSNLFGIGIWYAYIFHPDCLRLRSIDSALKTKEFQTEIIAGGLADYFRNGASTSTAILFLFPLLKPFIEYFKARESLGDLTISEDVYSSLYRMPFGGGLRTLLQGILNDSPFHVQFFTILRDPTSFSLTAMTLLQTTSSHLRYTVWKLLQARKGFTQNAEVIRDYFDYLKRQSAIVDGTVDFEEGEKIRGMKIEFR